MTSPIPRPAAPYFLIRVSIKEEQQSKEKVGSIFIPGSATFMEWNTQRGEIIGIGERAAEYFPEAKIGHTLLMHHGVQGFGPNEAREKHLVHFDDDYNYYVVSAYAYSGKDCETYGVWDGEKVIPNKDYVFLQKRVTDIPNVNFEDLTDEKVNAALEVSKAGILMFKGWEESRESKEARQAELKSQAQELSKSGNHKLHIKQEILRKEWAMEELSREINAQTYQPHEVAFSNKELSQWFDQPVGPGSILGMLNISVHTTIKVEGVEYIVAKAKFIAYLYDKKAA